MIRHFRARAFRQRARTSQQEAARMTYTVHWRHWRAGPGGLSTGLWPEGRRDFSHRACAPAYEAVDRQVYDRVRHFLRRRQKVKGRGTKQFSREHVFGELQVFGFDACTQRRRRGPGVKSVGKPDAGNRHVRFDERGRETGATRHRALPRLYYFPVVPILLICICYRKSLANCRKNLHGLLRLLAIRRRRPLDLDLR